MALERKSIHSIGTRSLRFLHTLVSSPDHRLMKAWSRRAPHNRVIGVPPPSPNAPPFPMPNIFVRWRRSPYTTNLGVRYGFLLGPFGLGVVLLEFIRPPPYFVMLAQDTILIRFNQ